MPTAENAPLQRLKVSNKTSFDHQSSLQNPKHNIAKPSVTDKEKKHFPLEFTQNDRVTPS